MSYGWGCAYSMPDGTKITFVHNQLTGSERLDERNLRFCKYLNLQYSSITSLDVAYMPDLELLVLCNTKIKKIDLTCLKKLKKV